jgi:hypothetical protein
LNLRRILNEAAADQAHQKGLKSAGYGRWADKSGKIVARTVDGQLVAVRPEDPTGGRQKGKAEPKPKGMSAKDAGTAPSNTPTAKDVAKTTGQSEPGKEKKDSKGGGEQASPMAVHDDGQSHYRTKLQYGKPVEAHTAAKELEGLHGAEAVKEIVIGEEVIMVGDEEWNDFFTADPAKNGLLNPQGVELHAQISAFKQDNGWRQKLSPKDYKTLIGFQAWWQEKPKEERPKAQREYVSAFFDKVSKGPPPAKCSVAQPIERGMRIDVDDIEDFLKDLHIGEDVNLPCSGFSAKAAEAREFATGGIGIVGVVWRLAPDKNGNVNGIHFSGLDIPPEKEQERDIYKAYCAMYDKEQEILRPSWSRTRCVGVKKLVYANKGSLVPHVRVCYVIDIQEAESDAKEVSLPESYKYDWDKPQTNSVFDAYMNTSFNATKYMPIKMKDLVTESKASDQAHALGLRYKGHGYWTDKQGVTVAQSVGDNLVKLEPDQVPPEHQGKAKTEPEPAPSAPNTAHQAEPNNNSSATVAAYIMNEPVDVGIEKGMNEGGTYKGADGVIRYVKFYHNPVAAYDEKVANGLYNAIGVTAPKSVIFEHEGKVGFASELVKNKGELRDYCSSNGRVPKELANKVLNGFVADCFLASWDVVGVNEGYMRNIVVTEDDNVCRIDNGGSLLTGGLGNLKPEGALHQLNEWTFFPEKNPSYRKIFESAGIKTAEELGKYSLSTQILQILILHKNSGGWEKYLAKNEPDVPEPVRKKIAAMLEARTRLLAKKVEAL